MVEPLGVASAVITFVEATAALRKFVKTLKNVPHDLLAMHNELSELHILVRQVEYIIGRDLSAQSILERPVHSAVDEATKLRTLLSGIPQVSGVQHVKGLLKISKLRSLQQSLRRSRLGLAEAVSIANLYVCHTVNLFFVLILFKTTL